MTAKSLTAALGTVILSSCTSNKDKNMGTYGFDLDFFRSQGIETVELSSSDGLSRIFMVPAYQGRVMTSTASGLEGRSFGWINHKHISSGLKDPQFNPYGGEERLWVGPEGGPNSFFFKNADKQDFSHWLVPAFLDTDVYDIVAKDSASVTFRKSAKLTNARGLLFDMELTRKVSLADRTEAACELGVELPSDVRIVAYTTCNTITNTGERAWEKETGVPCLWMLGCFNPSVTTTVMIPYNKEAGGKIVNADYLGKLSQDRLRTIDGIVYFRIDGNYRSKIGLPKESAMDLCGSYDCAQGVLNILKFSRREGDYVNEVTGPQEDTFNGDVVNSYNDGPTETGVVMGPFFEMESSSPGAVLTPGESLAHTQMTIHLEGTPEELSKVMESVFGVSAAKVSKVFCNE